MRRVSKGYTIIEVLIFLAISGVLLASAMLLINGKQNVTEFNQKMRDTKSKIDDWLNDVSTGFTGGSPDDQKCVTAASATGTRPQVQSGAPGAGYQPSCIFLGKALLFRTSAAGNGQILAYSVFGCRVTPCGSAAGSLPIDYASATPTPQIGPAPGLDLTETFGLSPANIDHVTVTGTILGNYPGSQLIGFFNSFNTNSENGASDVNINEFKYTGSGPPPTDCLMLLGPCRASPPLPLTSYKVCLTDGRRYADVIITSTNGVGTQTNLQYVNSLASC